MPEQRKRLFDNIQSMRERIWMASANQIAQWWRDRERVSVALEPHARGYLLTATVTHLATAPEPVSIWVNLPRRNSRMRLQALQKGGKAPEVVAKDPWRAVIILRAPAVGKHAWLLQFEDLPSTEKL